MIFIDRRQVPIPQSLAPTGTAQRERMAILDRLASGTLSGFKYKAYRSQDVADALHLLFHGKCAYCEFKYAAGVGTDVEHFRPKAGVDEDESHPGYWWLASDWDNLLPSCPHCNRKRRHKLALPGMTVDALRSSAHRTLLGKHTKFPIQGQRAQTDRDSLTAEGELLIDPCAIDPNDHLHWLVDEEIAIVGGVDQIGTTSVEVFGLNRQDLAEARTELKLRIDLRLASIRKLVQDTLSLGPGDRPRFIQHVISGLEELRMLGEENAEFSSFAKRYVESNISALTEQVRDLSAQEAPTTRVSTRLG